MKDYFVEGTSWDEICVKSYEKEDEIWGGKTPYENQFTISVSHEDGSLFVVSHCLYRWGLMNKIECLIVYPEHNSILVFAIEDLNYFIVDGFTHKEVIIFDGKEIIK